MRKTILSLMSLGLLASSAVGTAAAGPRVEQFEPVRWHMQSGNPHGSEVSEGAFARLVRKERGISFSIHTLGLNPRHAYTVWLVVVNNPGACTATPCSPVDILTNPATRGQVTYATGRITGSDGGARFNGRIAAGPLPDGWLPDQGLDDPLGAEIHLVLNDHGPMLSEYMPEQITTYRAGCTDESLPPIFPDTARADGTPGPNTCQLRQFVAFL